MSTSPRPWERGRTVPPQSVSPAGKLRAYRDKARADPLSVAKRLPWQEPVWALLVGWPTWPWQRETVAVIDGRRIVVPWGPAPTCRPKRVHVIGPNRAGKTAIATMAWSTIVRGEAPEWQRPGLAWAGTETLNDATRKLRPKLEAWLGPNVTWSPKSPTQMGTESVLVTPAGWRGVLKSYDATETGHGRNRWQGDEVRLILLDEQPPDGVLREAESRLLGGGLLLSAFTPLGGTNSSLFKDAFGPWQEYRRKHARVVGPPCPVCGAEDVGPKLGEIRPGEWVVTCGARDNARSRSGVYPDAEIDAWEAKLLREGRAAEAQVRVHGEWLDMSEDRLIPVESLRQWSDVPKGGWLAKVIWLDPAVSKTDHACEAAIAVSARSVAGGAYLLESRHGRWPADIRLRECADAICRHDDGEAPFRCYVQNTYGDVMFMEQVNAELQRRGRRASVEPHPAKVVDKVTRANLFAPMVSAGQVHVRPEHLEGDNSFGAQARVFSGAYRGLCDTLDAGMGALMAVVEESSGEAAWLATERGYRPRTYRSIDNPWRDDGDSGARHDDDASLPDSMLGAD